MAKDRNTETDTSHEAHAKGSLLDSVRQSGAAANHEGISNWLGFARNLSAETYKPVLV